MNEVCSIEYGQHLGGAPLIFSITESGDGSFGIANGGVWVSIPPIAYELLHNFLRQRIDGANPPPFVSSAVETSPGPFPADVTRLVIAARAAWEDATDEDALCALDRALEPFAELVPYANEPQPEACAVNGKPIGPDDWQCGDGKLRSALALALVIREPKLIGDPAFQRVVEDLAYDAGKRATTLALSRLMPGALGEDEIPF